MGGQGQLMSVPKPTSTSTSTPTSNPIPLSMEDRALKFIEANNTAIWLAIAALAVVVVLFKRV